MSEGHFLSRWSRLKHGAKAKPGEPPAAAPQPVAAAAPAAAPEAPTQLAEPQSGEPQPLQAVETLTPESDFTPFMKADVDPGVRRQALKALFADPQFNVMDGLDVYIDDYSKADPLPEGWLEKLNVMSRLGAYVEPEEKDGVADGEKVVLAPEVAPEAVQVAPAAPGRAADAPDTLKARDGASE